MPLLEIKNLTLEIESGGQYYKALDMVSLVVNENEIRALVGESGSGKSLIVRAISGALMERYRITADRLNWDGKDLLRMSHEARRAIMRRDIAVIFQDPKRCLDPSTRLGQQLLESIPDEFVTHGKWWHRSRLKRTIAHKLLHNVGLEDPHKVMGKYVHELSEDICQKFLIAMALISRPRLLIADDPTRGMEVTAKRQILNLLDKLNKRDGLSILLVSHDLLTISGLAHSMTIIYCGQTVESGPVDTIKERAAHPYTQALMASAPSFTADLQRKSKLSAMAGTIPTLQHLPIGCRLGPRCPRASKECVRMPTERFIAKHSYRCHFPLHLKNKDTSTGGNA